VAIAREIPTPPWDRESDEHGGAMLAYGCATVPLFLVVCSFAILAGGSLLILIGGMVQGHQNLQPVGMLRAVRLYVAPHFRDHFFTEFERVFPGLLPKPYRAAVEGTLRAQGREGT